MSHESLSFSAHSAPSYFLILNQYAGMTYVT